MGEAQEEVPTDLHAAPNFGAAPTQGPDEPLMLAAEGAGDGGAHPNQLKILWLLEPMIKDSKMCFPLVF